MPDSKARGAPDAVDRAAGPSSDEWIAACRRAVERQREIFAEHSGIEERTKYEGVGEGGDRTLVIDRLCEDAIFDELDKLHAQGHGFTAISEERGTVEFGEDAGSLAVVIDPIDGSLNARRTIPWHSVSIAIADGDSMADVAIGYVYEFGAGEEFVAERGAGATLDGNPIRVLEGDGLEVVSLESNKPARLRAAADALDGHAYRLRTPGSIAISLSYVGAGRYDAMLSSRCRSVDAAAAQLIAREAGGFVSFGGAELSETPLSLDARYDVAGARTEDDLAIVLDVLRQLP